jgi:hypothetical protein
LISLANLNLVEHVFVPIVSIFILPIQYDKPFKSIFILHVQIAIPPNTFKQHLPKIFFQPEVGKMEIKETLA